MGKEKGTKPSLIIVDAMISNKDLPETCGECRFWHAFSCILKPTLRGLKTTRITCGCPLRAYDEDY